MSEPVAGRRVLVVDDEPMLRQLLSMALQRSWKVDTAASGEEAEPLLAENPYAVVVVDKNLPGMSGLDLVRKLRERDQAVAVLMITGYGSVESALETMHVGVDGYLEKPFDDILTVVRAVEEAYEKQMRRRQTGSLAAAVNHFKKASGHLHALAHKDAREVKLRILVACAAAKDGAWVTEHLAGAGDQIEQVTDFPAAQERLRSQPPDVLFLDAALVTGDLALKVAELHTLARDTATVVLAPRPPLDLVARLIKLEVLGLIEKPLDAEQFKRRIPGVLDRLRVRRRGASPDK